jgi:hypothetical protein
MQSLSYLKGRRLWVVRDVVIWGLPSDAEFHYLGVENVDSSGRLMFGYSSVGNSAQDIRFNDLIDHKGNRLPSTIMAPRVLIRPRSPYNAYLVGEESGSGFRVARDPSAPGPVNVDFFVYETGN